ncbi:hypothetical protein [Loktanella sp. Alg231-35]|uniref:hypothetical protein n=1 Tax=Loktanella sp. Alg231-35 TaxID=1922220 RepID=UPI00131ED6E0|nr:hypothetical protein [Loktanella sp. Alg231-35]
MTKVSGKIGRLIAALVAMSVPTIGSANEIALTFIEQGFTVKGEFKDFVDNTYMIVTQYGAMSVPAAMVTCEGPDCIEIFAANTANG